MIFFISALSVIQSFAISIGVGSSTLAILNFFSAIKDGVIDETERRMMGIVYKVLRLAMAGILISTYGLFQIQYVYHGVASFSLLDLAQLFTLSVLFLNAALMTAHVMPSTFGPALQAGNWYALGFITAIKTLPFSLSFLQLSLSYITWIVFAISLVNGVMAWMKAHRNGFIKK